MDSWVQSERKVSGPGLNALNADVVQGWRTGLKSALTEFTTLSERQKAAEKEQKAYVDKTKVRKAQISSRLQTGTLTGRRTSGANKTVSPCNV